MSTHVNDYGGNFLDIRRNKKYNNCDRRRLSMIEMASLTKKYGKLEALKGIDLKVGEGKLMAFLGPNGAGKTTAIRIMSGIIKPDSGDARICGHSILTDPDKAKWNFGYIPDNPMLFEYLCGIDYLNLVMDIFRIPKAERAGRVEKYLDAFDMREAVIQQIAGYSLGMKKKISMIAAFCHEPRVLFLDEPTSGLDPKSIMALGGFLKGFASEGKTVLFSTHILDIAEKLCNTAAIIARGRIIAEGDIAELRVKASAPGGSLEEIFMQLTLADSDAAASSNLSEINAV